MMDSDETNGNLRFVAPAKDSSGSRRSSSGHSTYRNMSKVVCINAAFLCLGLCTAYIGPGIFDLCQQTASSVGEVSRLFVGRAAGSLFGAGAGLLTADSAGSSYGTTAVALASLAVGVAILPWCRHLAMLVGAFVIQGTAIGLIGTRCTAICQHMWGRSGSTQLYVVHLSFGIGAMAGSLLIESFITDDAIAVPTTLLPLPPLFLPAAAVTNGKTKGGVGTGQQKDDLSGRRVRRETADKVKEPAAGKPLNAEGGVMMEPKITNNGASTTMVTKLQPTAPMNLLVNVVKMQTDRNGSDVAAAAAVVTDMTTMMTKTGNMSTVETTLSILMATTGSVEMTNGGSNSGLVGNSTFAAVGSKMTNATVANVTTMVAITTTTAMPVTPSRPKKPDAADGNKLSNNVKIADSSLFRKEIRKVLGDVPMDVTPIPPPSPSLTTLPSSSSSPSPSSSLASFVSASKGFVRDVGADSMVTLVNDSSGFNVTIADNANVTVLVPATAGEVTAAVDENPTGIPTRTNINVDGQNLEAPTSQTFSSTATTTVRPALQPSQPSQLTITAMTSGSTSGFSSTSLHSLSSPSTTAHTPTVSSTQIVASSATTASIEKTLSGVSATSQHSDGVLPSTDSQTVRSSMMVTQTASMMMAQTAEITPLTTKVGTLQQNTTVPPLVKGDDGSLAMLLGRPSTLSTAYWIIAVFAGLASIMFTILWATSPHCCERHHPQPDVERRSSGSDIGPTTAAAFVATVILHFFHFGAESTYGGLIGTFAAGSLGWTQPTAALLAVAFWSAFAVGRVLCVVLAGRLRPWPLLFAASAISFVALISVTLALLEHSDAVLFAHWHSQPMAVWTGSIVFGIACSLTVPAGARFFAGRGAEAAIVVGSSAGELILPALAGGLSNVYAADWIVYTVFAAVAGGAFACTVLRCIVPPATRSARRVRLLDVATDDLESTMTDTNEDEEAELLGNTPATELVAAGKGELHQALSSATAGAAQLSPVQSLRRNFASVTKSD